MRRGGVACHLDPHVEVPAHTPHFVLELLPFPQPILGELGLISDELRGRLEVLLLQLLRLPQDLLRCDLQQPNDAA